MSVLRAFDNIVPTGLALAGNTVYMAEAGPVPHVPETGKIVSFRPKSTNVTEVASGARLLVDVESGRGRRLYALSQGVVQDGGNPRGAGVAEHGLARAPNDEVSGSAVALRLPCAGA